MATTNEGPPNLPPPRLIESGAVGASNHGASDRRVRDASWGRRTFAERRLGNRLDRALGVFAMVLHDRQLTGADGSVDYIVVAASGVWVISANSEVGRIERQVTGGKSNESSQSVFVDVLVDGSNQRSSMIGLIPQAQAAGRCLERIGYDWVDVCSAVCFTNADWAHFAKPFKLDNTWITSPKTLVELIGAAGPLAPSDTQTIAAALR